MILTNVIRVIVEFKTKTMITEEKFCDYINYIQFLLTLVDENRSQPHIRAIIKKIQESFPIDENGHCEISHYCFDLNFGKPTPDGEYESPQELYERLTILNKQ
jgi:hypothetical protein